MPLPRHTATQRETRFQDSAESLRAAIVQLDYELDIDAIDAGAYANLPAVDFSRACISLDLLAALDRNPIPAPPPGYAAELASATVISAGADSDYADWAVWLSEVDNELAALRMRRAGMPPPPL